MPLAIDPHRNVGDIFLMFEKRDHVKRPLKYLNSCDPNIQFTCEEESNDNTLGIPITRINNRLIISLYREKTVSGVCLSFNSFLPMDYKKGLIRNLLVHVYNICANYTT